ncbi:MAG: SHOCT domain-containing protein [Nitrospiria bacterium]
MYSMYSHGYGIGFFWWLIPLLFFLFFIFMAALFFRRGGMFRMMCPVCGHHYRHYDESLSAKEILEKRYARGEIGREEYQKIKEDLEAK